MKNIIIFTILMGTVLMLSGCVAQDSVESTTDSLATHVTDIRQINEALLDGPVLIKIGAEWCPSCVEMGPIIDTLAGEYEGRAAVMYIDIDDSPELSNFFNVGYIPDTFVIFNVKNGQYIYMGTDEITSAQREDVRLIGLLGKYTPGLINKQKILDEKRDRFETTKDEFAERLDNAIELNK